MRRLQLRAKITLLVIFGIIITSTIGLITTVIGLVRVQNNAVANSELILNEQARNNLLELATTNTRSIVNSLHFVEQTAEALANALISDSTITINEPPFPKIAEDGRYYVQGTTTTIIDATPSVQVLGHITQTNIFEAIMPIAKQVTPDILRVSYISEHQFIRTYPAALPQLIDPRWELQNDLAFHAGNPTNNPTKAIVWTKEHRAFSGSEEVLSAVKPVYRDGQFLGVMSVDYQIRKLDQTVATMDSNEHHFLAIVDTDGFLVAATAKSQKALFGRFTSNLSERRTMQIDRSDPNIRDIFTTKEDQRGTISVMINDVPYLIGYAPIRSLRFILLVAIPQSEFEVTTAAHRQGVRKIARETLIGSIALSLLLIGCILWFLRVQLRREFIQPLDSLISATDQVAAGDLKPIDIVHRDELGQLARSFNRMIEGVQASRAEIIANNQRLEELVQARTSDLQAAMNQTASVVATQQQLLETLNHTMSPLIAITRDAMVMPLVGQLNRERVSFATRELLQTLQRQPTKTVLLDLTGTAYIDNEATEELVKLIAAARLLGASIQLVGISPVIADALVQYGDLQGVKTSADLRSAIATLK